MLRTVLPTSEVPQIDYRSLQRMKTKHYVNLFAVCLTLIVAFTYADEKEDEDSNLFTTKDPKMREPSPCEGTSMKNRF